MHPRASARRGRSSPGQLAGEELSGRGEACPGPGLPGVGLHHPARGIARGAGGEVGEEQEGTEVGSHRGGAPRAKRAVPQALGDLLQEPFLVELLGPSEKGLPGGGEQVVEEGAGERRAEP